MTVTYPYGIDPGNKERRLLEALELNTDVVVHPNQQEVLTRTLLTLDVDRLGPIIVLIEHAKTRYHERKTAEQG